MWGCIRGRRTPRDGRELLEPAGNGVPVHAHPAPVQQQRTGCSFTSGTIHGAAHCGRQRNQYHLAALAADSQDSMAVFLSEVGDVGSGRLEDS